MISFLVFIGGWARTSSLRASLSTTSLVEKPLRLHLIKIICRLAGTAILFFSLIWWIRRFFECAILASPCSPLVCFPFFLVFRDGGVRFCCSCISSEISLRSFLVGAMNCNSKMEIKFLRVLLPSLDWPRAPLQESRRCVYSHLQGRLLLTRFISRRLLFSGQFWLLTFQRVPTSSSSPTILSHWLNLLHTDVTTIEKNFVHHVEYTLAQTRQNLDKTSTFQALALSVRDRLVERWKDTQVFSLLLVSRFLYRYLFMFLLMCCKSATVTSLVAC